MEGTPYHKKRKKGAKRKLDRRKRTSSCAPEKENVPPPPQCTLPKHWQVHATDEGTQYIKMEHRLGEMCCVSSSVALHEDGTWTTFFTGKKIPPSNELLTTFPLKITPSALQSLILSIDNAVLCPGNPDAEYVSICRGRKDGKMSGDRGFGQTIAFIDESLGDLNRKGSANMYMYMYRSYLLFFLYSNCAKYHM